MVTLQPTSNKARKVSPVKPSKSMVNELDSAGTLLDKQKITPSRDSLADAHSEPKSKNGRRGQLIDILV